LTGYLTKARTFYERGFIIAKDYYNGINLAYLLLQTASMATTKEEKIAETFLAARIRQQVFAICQDKLNSLNFSEMSDKTWILLTLAEISFTNGNTDDEQKYLHIAQLQGAKPFELDSYADQKNKLSVLLGKLKK
jgi:aminoglycoside phosphotransferase